MTCYRDICGSVPDRDGASEYERELTAQRFGTSVVPLENGVNAP